MERAKENTRTGTEAVSPKSNQEARARGGRLRGMPYDAQKAALSPSSQSYERQQGARSPVQMKRSGEQAQGGRDVKRAESAAALAPEEKQALANQIRDQIPYAADAYMKACRDKQRSLEAAAKKKVEVAGMALDLVMAMVPPSFSTVAKNTLMGVSRSLEGAALEQAVEHAEGSLRGGLVRANMSVWSKNLKAGLDKVVVGTGDPADYVSTLEKQAPLSFSKMAGAITWRLPDAEIIAHAGYWFSDTPKNVDHYAQLIEQKVAVFEALTDTINLPGVDWEFEGGSGALAYCVDDKGARTENPVGSTMAVVDFLKGDETEVIAYVPPGMEAGALAKHLSEYGSPPRKFICDGGRAVRFAE
ncbi:MAG: hypothetical protein ACQEXJ_21125 [Myxococcota bacterium]